MTIRAAALAFTAALALAVSADAEGLNRVGVKTAFVAFPVTAAGKTWSTAGELRVPPTKPGERRAAVLVVHGSGGVDSRGGRYVQALNDAGFATLEIDLWAPRNVREPLQRPKTVPETLPDAWAALAFLAAQPDIDASRIGIMGFSWGGVVSMLTAGKAYQPQGSPLRFAAHAPNYPVCWVYNHVPGYTFKDLTGAPVLIQSGDADLYDQPDTCDQLVASLAPADKALVRHTRYPNATHGWERLEPAAEANDPYSHLGKGGMVPLKANPKAAKASISATVAFFKETLAAR